MFHKLSVDTLSLSKVYSIVLYAVHSISNLICVTILDSNSIPVTKSPACSSIPFMYTYRIFFTLQLTGVIFNSLTSFGSSRYIVIVSIIPVLIGFSSK